MLILYCCDPLNPRKPDPDYAAEAAAAHHHGLPHALISYEALVRENRPDHAVQRVHEAVDAAPLTAIYRGWMLTPEQYSRLWTALEVHGIAPINTPAAYRYCHYLPEWYPALAAYTPRSVWTTNGATLDMDAIMTLLQPFGDAPLILKDYVKSRKHEWAEACYIPSAADRAAVERVARRFIALQGPDLVGGLVFRQYVPFAPLASHAQSGMPLTEEYRLFYLDGQRLAAYPYWDTATYPAAPRPTDPFDHLAHAIPSRFFTMDIARTQAGDWQIVELGDGQVAGLPDGADVEEFYARLHHTWAHRHHPAH
jgi:hypothetical protein